MHNYVPDPGTHTGLRGRHHRSCCCLVFCKKSLSLGVRFPGTRKAFDARVALLAGLAAAARLRSHGSGLGRRFDADGRDQQPPPAPPPSPPGKRELLLPRAGGQIRNGTGDATTGLGFGTGHGVDEEAANEAREKRAEKTADAMIADAPKCDGLTEIQASSAGVA